MHLILLVLLGCSGEPSETTCDQSGPPIAYFVQHGSGQQAMQSCEFYGQEMLNEDVLPKDTAVNCVLAQET